MCDWDEDDRMLKVADFEVENKKKLKNLEMERFQTLGHLKKIVGSQVEQIVEIQEEQKM